MCKERFPKWRTHRKGDRSDYEDVGRGIKDESRGNDHNRMCRRCGTDDPVDA